MKSVLLRILLSSALTVLVTGCAFGPSDSEPVAGPKLPPADAVRFGPKPELPAPEQLFSLEPEQVEDLRRYMGRFGGSGRHKHLFDYLQRITEGFNYQEDTFMAAEALRLQRGNCLTLAILTTALARSAGIEVGYQLVNDAPVFEFGGTLVLKGVHVRSRLFDPGWEKQTDSIVFSRPGISIDYFPSGNERFISNLEENAFIAMYYRNIAADALRRDDLDTAYWYAREAFEYDPGEAASLNLLAVINRRGGNAGQAEALYLYGIENARDKLSLLKNYRVLLLAQGREQEARRVELKLNTIDDPSPFHWFQLARDAMESGELDEAIRYYRKALQLAPYLHEAYLGLAQASYRAGKPESARRALHAALDNVYRSSTRRSYKAKLHSLERELDAGEG